jgi:NitT/TauT family transport system permease protein
MRRPPRAFAEVVHMTVGTRAPSGRPARERTRDPSLDPPPEARSRAAQRAAAAGRAVRAWVTPGRARWAAPVMPAAAVLLLWLGLTHGAHVSRLLLPAPGAVAATFWQGVTTGWLLNAAGVTLLESLAGFVLGAVVALPLGYAVARSRWMSWAIQPYLAASQALPAVALAPLLAVWLGYGLPPTAALGALITFFPATIATTLGLRALDGAVLDAARVDGAGRWALLREIEVPLALPAILAGLRTSLTLSVTGAVVSEFVIGGAGIGLGSLLTQALGHVDTAALFAILFMLALLAAALYGAARLVEHRVSYLEAD